MQRCPDIWIRTILAGLLLCSASTRVFANEFYVSPEGTANGDGSRERPWNLATALAAPPAVQPGDTVWIGGGTYRGRYESNLRGTSSNPIVVRAMPGETVIIDGAPAMARPVILTIRGAYSWFWDLEVMDSNGDRVHSSSGSNPPGVRPNGVDAYGPGTKLIDLVVHDSGNGVGLWAQAASAELYGSVIYNNGWSAPDRKHGHAIYAQNQKGVLLIQDNIIGPEFDFGMHIYGSGNAFLNNIVVDGNIHFSSPFLLGGQGPAHNITVTNNSLYASGMALGYSNKQNSAVTVRDNYLPNGLALLWWNEASVTGNFITNIDAATDPQQAIAMVRLPPGAEVQTVAFDRNDYVHATPGTEFAGYDGAGHMFEGTTFSAWKALGFDPHSHYVVNPRLRPTGVHVVVRPNRYDLNRANIAIYNWDLRKTVSVDLSGLGFASGDKLELRNAQNYGAESIRFVYQDRPIDVQMSGWTVATPIGWASALAPATSPEFGAFVLKRVAAAPAVISNIESKPAGGLDVAILWRTATASVGRVEFGKTAAYGRSVTSGITPRQDHQVSLKNLLPGEMYHYRVLASNPLGKVTVSQDLTFVAPAETAPDGRK